MREQKEIIVSIPREELVSEFTKDKLIRNTNFGNNKIYSITAEDSPAVMREVGRLREVTFRQAGGGTGKECDIDDFATGPHSYKQLIVWDNKRKEILGGYRYILCKDVEFFGSS